MVESGGYADDAFVADFYDHVIPYRNRADIEFYVQSAEESGGPVLEIGCGTGRILVPVARSGVEIVGVDLSSYMLAICRERLQRESEEVQSRAQIVNADMRDFNLDRTFALVTTPFRPFQHLTTVEGQISCLENVNRHLIDGGTLILDLFNPSLDSLTRDDLGEETGEEPAFEMPDGSTVLRRQKVVERDLFNQINHVELIYYVTHPDGREERLVHAFPMRYLFRFEAEHLLERCGFEVVDVYSDFDKSPFGSTYPGELIIVARKTRSRSPIQ
jgi:SAM-dependent methyltransferase